MPADYARTQAQIAAQSPLDAPVSAAQPKSGSVPVPPPARRTGAISARDGHDRPGMIPRDPLQPPNPECTDWGGRS